MNKFISNRRKFLPAVLYTAIILVFFLAVNGDRQEAIALSDLPDSLKKPVTDTSKVIEFENIKSPVRMEAKSLNENIGLSVGGAKDINNFRKNIENGYLPSIDDITYEGLYYDYYFETGNDESKCNEPFCPAYTCAVSKNPITQNEEYFLSVGLNSNIKQSDFKRKKLNIIIVLDRSGSMGSNFAKYYYDKVKNNENSYEYNTEEENKSKLEIARKTVANIIDHLSEEDKFSFITFDSQAELVTPLTGLNELDVQKVKNDIMAITPRGGTYLSKGYEMGVQQFAGIEINKDEYENRIILLTDEMPNIGVTNETELQSMTKSAALRGIYTTIIGIGIDFNSTLTEFMSKVRGANYFSVHSSKEFKKRLNDEFDYMVTPLFFNVKLTLISDGFEIQKIYGSPEADESTGEVLKVNTLFPSDKDDEETRGGIILVKLKKNNGSNEITLKVNYEDREGNELSNRAKIKMTNKTADYFDNTGVRKAILLARYADLMKSWLGNEKSITNNEYVRKNDNAFILNNGKVIMLNKWERLSQNLFVPGEYKELFGSFEKYYISESYSIGDTTLNKEAKVLDKLINTK
ncbi:MAG: VWA domain-containing protein [Ignavibacteriae bacterium]|nr:MAG: VWA domain-containing protein [Ignavibacteriota bacterium]